MTTENITSGASPITASDVELTEITSSGAGGEQIVRLLMLGLGAVPSRIGSRHVISFKTQTDPADVLKVQVFDPSGENQQSAICFDSAGSFLHAVDDGNVLLQYELEFASFEWDGTRWVFDNRAKMNQSVMLPQNLYVPSPTGFTDGASLKLVNGQPAWVSE